MALKVSEGLLVLVSVSLLFLFTSKTYVSATSLLDRSISSNNSSNDRDDHVVVEVQTINTLVAETIDEETPGNRSRTLVKRSKNDIRCYSCTYSSQHLDRSCLDPMYEPDVPDLPCQDFCLKTIIKASHLLIRGCSQTCNPVSNEDMTVLCCKTDNCNTASKVEKQCTLVTVIVLLVTFLFL